jgi:hypothetical protein
MADKEDETINDATLTKPKKPRSEAQKQAFEKMRQARDDKNALTADEKKLRLKAIKEQLNGPAKKELPAKDDTESEEEAPPAPAPVAEKKKAKIVSQPKKKEPKVIYQSATESESEEEVIIVKKKKKVDKKKKKKTVIYESATESEEEEIVKPVRRERETKTQQNVASKFKVTPGVADKPKPAGPVCYFLD